MLARTVRLGVVIALTVSAPTAALAQPAVSFDIPHTFGCGPNNVEGWEFQTTESIMVSALGVWDSPNGGGPFTPGDGLNFSIPVGLYDASCTELASVTIPAGTTATLIDTYRYVGITPVVLPTGQTFRVAAVIRCDDSDPEFNSLTTVTINPALTAVQTRRIGFGSMLACPTETSPVFGFAPNFIIGPSCGNGVVQDGEQCDDGNVSDGDCCSATCQIEADDTPCTDDGLYCSGIETCQDGACTSSGDPCVEDTVCDELTDQCVTPSPTPSVTPTAIDTATHTPSPTTTVTRTATVSGTPSATATRTDGGSATPTASPTRTTTGTASGSATATFSPADTATATASSAATLTAAATSTHTPVPIACVGDCDGSGGVTINELIIGVNIALGTLPIDRCRAFDASGNGGVEINELIAAVNNALDGCA
jgi:cysteine-rich repeat protein